MTDLIVSIDLRDALAAPYVPSWACRDSEPLQRALNELYGYSGDVETKVLHRSRLNLFDRVMRRLERRSSFRAKRRALDLGCNAGYYSKLISDFGFESVLGIDIDREAVDRARRFLGCERVGATRRFEVANAEELDAAGQYDFILCTEVIEHTGDSEVVIDRVGRALAPGGLAFVTLPNAISVAYAWAVLAHTLKRQPPDAMLQEHLSFPFYRSLRAFEHTGLRTREVHGTNLLLPQPLITLLYGRPGFGALHHASAVCAAGPLKYVSQFLAMVMEKAPSEPGSSVPAP